jgi:two-component system chemotaxis sensor kinase CheA
MSADGADERAMDELTREFLVESQEGLDRMERCLTDLESQPSDAGLLGEIFRSVHTIKGTTGFLGFKRLEKLAHAGENLLGLLRDGKMVADRTVITGLLQLLDGLRAILTTIEAEDAEGAGDDALLISLMEELQTPAARTVHAQTSASLPAAPAVAAPAVADRPNASEVKPAHGAMPTAEPERPTTRGVASAATASAAESTLRVDISLLNRMMNLVGELVLTRNQVLQATASDPNMRLLSRRLDMVTADLRESVMKARMQPVSNIFSKMPRIVRDVSQLLGRQVRLQMDGQDTELDKSLLEAIKDPLTHAVRNSLDHGIEPPEVRIAAGKDPQGLLRLRAAQEGSHVVIEVSDDGAGIAVEKVVQKAIDRGLIEADRAAEMNERELLQLIFLPGLSTAAAVTNVSGRGVGMDVVRTNVERIGGKVEIDSRTGKGTTLRLRIPLTLAIIPALIVRSRGRSFALPQGAVLELVHVPREQAAQSIEWIEDAPLYRLRGKLLPLIFLDCLLKAEKAVREAAVRNMFIAVLDADGRHYGLVVDGLADPEEIVVKPLSAVLKEIGLYSGATVLGNADLALILDPGAIGLRAGVELLADEQAAHGKNAIVESEGAGPVEYLLVEVAGRKAAVALSEVLRIEQIPLSRLEFIDYRPVLNLDGRLLPIDDTGGVLTAADGNPDARVVVVVCRKESRQVGIVVSHVLDVAAGSDLFGACGERPTAGVTLVKDRVTGVVDLNGLPDLPGEQEASFDMNEFAEKMR